MPKKRRVAKKPQRKRIAPTSDEEEEVETPVVEETAPKAIAELNVVAEPLQGAIPPVKDATKDTTPNVEGEADPGTHPDTAITEEVVRTTDTTKVGPPAVVVTAKELTDITAQPEVDHIAAEGLMKPDTQTIDTPVVDNIPKESLPVLPDLGSTPTAAVDPIAPGKPSTITADEVVATPLGIESKEKVDVVPKALQGAEKEPTTENEGVAAPAPNEDAKEEGREPENNGSTTESDREEGDSVLSNIDSTTIEYSSYTTIEADSEEDVPLDTTLQNTRKESASGEGDQDAIVESTAKELTNEDEKDTSGIPVVIGEAKEELDPAINDDPDAQMGTPSSEVSVTISKGDQDSKLKMQGSTVLGSELQAEAVAGLDKLASGPDGSGAENKLQKPGTDPAIGILNPETPDEEDPAPIDFLDGWTPSPQRTGTAIDILAQNRDWCKNLVYAVKMPPVNKINLACEMSKRCDKIKDFFQVHFPQAAPLHRFTLEYFVMVDRGSQSKLKAGGLHSVPRIDTEGIYAVPLHHLAPILYSSDFTEKFAITKITHAIPDDNFLMYGKKIRYQERFRFWLLHIDAGQTRAANSPLGKEKLKLVTFFKTVFPGIEADEVKSIEDGILKSGQTLLMVAYDKHGSQHYIGAVLYETTEEWTYINWIGVLPTDFDRQLFGNHFPKGSNFRKLGIATQLILLIQLQNVFAGRSRRILLQCNQNTAALPFYLNRGFKQEKQVEELAMVDGVNKDTFANCKVHFIPKAQEVKEGTDTQDQLTLLSLRIMAKQNLAELEEEFYLGRSKYWATTPVGNEATYLSFPFDASGKEVESLLVGVPPLVIFPTIPFIMNSNKHMKPYVRRGGSQQPGKRQLDDLRGCGKGAVVTKKDVLSLKHKQTEWLKDSHIDLWYRWLDRDDKHHTMNQVAMVPTTVCQAVHIMLGEVGNQGIPNFRTRMAFHIKIVCDYLYGHPDLLGKQLVFMVFNQRDLHWAGSCAINPMVRVVQHHNQDKAEKDMSPLGTREVDKYLSGIIQNDGLSRRPNYQHCRGLLWLLNMATKFNAMRVHGNIVDFHPYHMMAGPVVYEDAEIQNVVEGTTPPLHFLLMGCEGPFGNILNQSIETMPYTILDRPSTTHFRQDDAHNCGVIWCFFVYDTILVFEGRGTEFHKNKKGHLSNMGFGSSGCLPEVLACTEWTEVTAELKNSQTCLTSLLCRTFRVELIVLVERLRVLKVAKSMSGGGELMVDDESYGQLDEKYLDYLQKKVELDAIPKTIRNKFGKKKHWKPTKAYQAEHAMREGVFKLAEVVPIKETEKYFEHEKLIEALEVQEICGEVYTRITPYLDPSKLREVLPATTDEASQSIDQELDVEVPTVTQASQPHKADSDSTVGITSRGHGEESSSFAASSTSGDKKPMAIDSDDESYTSKRKRSQPNWYEPPVPIIKKKKKLTKREKRIAKLAKSASTPEPVPQLPPKPPAGRAHRRPLPFAGQRIRKCPRTASMTYQVANRARNEGKFDEFSHELATRLSENVENEVDTGTSIDFRGAALKPGFLCDFLEKGTAAKKWPVPTDLPDNATNFDAAQKWAEELMDIPTKNEVHSYEKGSKTRKKLEDWKARAEPHAFINGVCNVYSAVKEIAWVPQRDVKGRVLREKSVGHLQGSWRIKIKDDTNHVHEVCPVTSWMEENYPPKILGSIQVLAYEMATPLTIGPKKKRITQEGFLKVSHDKNLTKEGKTGVDFEYDGRDEEYGRKCKLTAVVTRIRCIPKRTKMVGDIFEKVENPKTGKDMIKHDAKGNAVKAVREKVEIPQKWVGYCEALGSTAGIVDLTQEWLDANFKPGFLAQARLLSKHKTSFCHVPLGAARSHAVRKPSAKGCPRVQYIQGKDQRTCLTYSLASAVHHLKARQTSSEIAGFAKKMSKSPDGFRTLTEKVAAKYHVTRNVWREKLWDPMVPQTKMAIGLYGIEGMDGKKDHCVAITGNWIFDSNFKTYYKYC